MACCDMWPFGRAERQQRKKQDCERAIQNALSDLTKQIEYKMAGIDRDLQQVKEYVDNGNEYAAKSLMKSILTREEDVADLQRAKDQVETFKSQLDHVNTAEMVVTIQSTLANALAAMTGGKSKLDEFERSQERILDSVGDLDQLSFALANPPRNQVKVTDDQVAERLKKFKTSSMSTGTGTMGVRLQPMSANEEQLGSKVALLPSSGNNSKSRSDSCAFIEMTKQQSKNMVRQHAFASSTSLEPIALHEEFD